MPRRSHIDDAAVREAVAAASNLTDALRRLGLRPARGNHATLRRRIERLGLSTDHFDPAAGRRRGRRTPIPLEDGLAKGSAYQRSRLKQRLYESGLRRPICEMCGQDELWHGWRMALILDHVNRDATDNRLHNLRIVCPNCAATLETHCGRNPRADREAGTVRAVRAAVRPAHGTSAALLVRLRRPLGPILAAAVAMAGP